MSEGICTRCGLGMLSVDTCIEQRVEVSTGEFLERILYGSEAEDLPERCGDCSVVKGGLHHQNCDMERCPKCGGQLMLCSPDECSVETSEELS